MNNGSTDVPHRVRLHHVGYVVASIEESGDSFARALGAKWDRNIVFDPIQNVRVTFLEGGTAADSTVELVEPAGPGSPVSRFLERGGGLHHLCYEVDALEEHLGLCKSAGTIVIKSPVPAVAFGGRRIAWAVTKKRLLVEFLESQAD